MCSVDPTSGAPVSGTTRTREAVQLDIARTRGRLPVFYVKHAYLADVPGLPGKIDAGTHDALPRSTMMNTAELLSDSYGTTRRATFVRAPEPIDDFDPTARHHVVEIDATVRVSGRELRSMFCRLRSLSVAGALVEFDRLPIGALINITFSLPGVDKRLSLDAIVLCCTRDGVNVLFDCPRTWEVGILWRYLVSLDEDAELEPTNAVLIKQAAAL